MTGLIKKSKSKPLKLLKGKLDGSKCNDSVGAAGGSAMRDGRFEKDIVG
jgi:hypothetical protein